MALSAADKRVLITTYTHENIRCIEALIVKQLGFIPSNIDVLPWFTFLLRDGVRPYQQSRGQSERVDAINFKSVHGRYLKRANLNYYFDKGNQLYQDVVTDFVCECNTRSGGLVIQRLEQIYDMVLIDEVQDLAGYDLDFIELMLGSRIEVVMVGDPRQSTFATSRSPKNKQLSGDQIAKWYEYLRTKGLLEVSEHSTCHRCNQSICDFADLIYPLLPKATSTNTVVTGHDGVFEINETEVETYLKAYQPAILRHNKLSKTYGHRGLNFGAAKGQTFDRVLVFPTASMKKFWKSRNHEHIGDHSKFYVAVTRARYSVALVI